MELNETVKAFKAFTLWFTGFSGAGKSTNAFNVYMELKRRGSKVELLDGDIIRTNFSRGLGFSRKDRDINIRRIGFISYLLNKNDIISIVAAISPYRQTRQQNRRLLENYIEVFCDCPLTVLEKRDPKGLYKRARSGEIGSFTGISDPYEPPQDPEIIVRSGPETTGESFGKVLSYLEDNRHVPCKADCILNDYSKEDEDRVKRHLISLGFAEAVGEM